MSGTDLATIKEKALERARTSSQTVSIRHIANALVSKDKNDDRPIAAIAIAIFPLIAAYLISLTPHPGFYAHFGTMVLSYIYTLSLFGMRAMRIDKVDRPTAVIRGTMAAIAWMFPIMIMSHTTVFPLIALVLYAIGFSAFSYQIMCTFQILETECVKASFTYTSSMLWRHVAALLRADLIPASEKRKKSIREIFQRISTMTDVSFKAQLLVSEGQQMLEGTMDAVETLEGAALKLLEVIETRAEIIHALEELGHVSSNEIEHHLDTIEEETLGVIEIVKTLTAPDSPLLEVAERYEKETLPETAKILRLPKS